MKTINRLTSPILAFVIVTAAVGRIESEVVDPAQALAAVQEKVLSKGPNGEEPSPASSVSLTTEEVERIRGLKAKAAIVMHYTQSDWSQAQITGLNRSLTKWESASLQSLTLDFKPKSKSPISSWFSLRILK